MGQGLCHLPSNTLPCRLPQFPQDFPFPLLEAPSLLPGSANAENISQPLWCCSVLFWCRLSSHEAFPSPPHLHTLCLTFSSSQIFKEIHIRFLGHACSPATWEKPETVKRLPFPETLPQQTVLRGLARTNSHSCLQAIILSLHTWALKLRVGKGLVQGHKADTHTE